MTPPIQVDPIEERLSHPPDLDGTRFTAEVLRSLPPRRRHLRPWILATGALLATGAAAALLASPAPALGPALLAATTGTMPEGTGLLALLALAALGVTAATVALGEIGQASEPAQA